MKRFAKKIFAPQALPLLMFMGASAAFIATACGPNHIRSTTMHTRDSPFEHDDEVAANDSERVSFWGPRSSGLNADFRARHVNDILTVVIDESVSATGDAATRLEREAESGLPGLFNLAGALFRAADATGATAAADSLMKQMATQDFEGSGSVSRGTTADATIACTVKDVQGGNLFIEGEKVILINHEELHIYISGVIRAVDIEQDNSIGSSLMAQAQVEFTGRGAISDTQRQGWLRRLMNKVRPF
jgi:flagellar L-ring protein precursor FlgH